MAYHDIRTENNNFLYFVNKTDPATDPHFHSSSEFLFVKSGVLLITSGGETRVLRSGDACFSPEFSIHSYYNHSNEPVNIYALLCNKNYIDRLFNLFNKKQPPTFFTFDDYDFLDYFLKECTQTYESEDIRQKLVEGFLQILYTKIATSVEFVPKKLEKQGELFCDILRFANDNYNKDLSLEVLSRQFGYARESISRIIHKHLSESWNSYVNRLRIFHANRILVNNPNKTVLEVAYDCGFNNIKSFYKTYKEEFGHPPRT